MKERKGHKKHRWYSISDKKWMKLLGKSEPSGNKPFRDFLLLSDDLWCAFLFILGRSSGRSWRKFGCWNSPWLGSWTVLRKSYWNSYFKAKLLMVGYYERKETAGNKKRLKITERLSHVFWWCCALKTIFGQCFTKLVRDINIKSCNNN